jgi:hypothetical protein
MTNIIISQSIKSALTSNDLDALVLSLGIKAYRSEPLEFNRASEQFNTLVILDGALHQFEHVNKYTRIEDIAHRTLSFVRAASPLVANVKNVDDQINRLEVVEGHVRAGHVGGRIKYADNRWNKSARTFAATLIKRYNRFPSLNAALLEACDRNIALAAHAVGIARADQSRVANARNEKVAHLGKRAHAGKAYSVDVTEAHVALAKATFTK